MDTSLYKTMDKIISEHPPLHDEDKDFKHDIKFLGTVTFVEETPTGDVTVLHDIFVIIDKNYEGKTVEKFYDETGTLLAGRGQDGQLYYANSNIPDNIDLFDQIEALYENETEHLPLSRLDEIAKEHGVTRKELLAMSSVSLDEQGIDLEAEQKSENGEEQLTLEENSGNPATDTQKQKNKDALENMNTKAETNLDNKVNSKNTLADVLGLPAGCKLIAVYSSSIKGNQNSTRFSFIIQHQDGTLEPADNLLEQIGGKDSNKEIVETNYDGSDLERKNVLSSYKIKSPANGRNLMLTARIGAMGYIEVDYAELDPYNNKIAKAQQLKTDRDHYTTPEVLKQFDIKGNNERHEQTREMASKATDGIESSEPSDIDGKFETGEMNKQAVEEIKQYDSKIQDIYSYNEILKYLGNMLEKHKNEKFEDIVTLTKVMMSNEVEHMHMPRMR